MHKLSPYEHVQGFTQKSLIALCNNSGLLIDWKYTFLNRPLIFTRLLLGRKLGFCSTTLIYFRKN
tara:strand:- start:17143 stop:17337 length:195 start_codon:yes stop_codon:yes gene_type:complete